MTGFLFFLGRFHVLLLHLPIGILLLAVVLEVLSRRERFRHLAPAVNAVWILGAITAIATAALGYLHASEGGFDGAALGAHRLAGTSLALIATLIALTRAKVATMYAKAWPVACVAVVALLFVTGHFGGNLTHGDTYLAQYAPGPLRSLMGVSAEEMPRARPASLASADIYLDVIAPAFRQRCSSCHNEGKRKGGLSLATWAALMKGGEKGAVIVAGQPQKSDLVRRISLSHDDADFMPKDGKTPLTAEQTTAIRWWVAAGAPRESNVLALKPPDDVRASVEVVLGMRDATNAARADALADANIPPADLATLDDLERRGFAVRAVAAGSALLQVDYTSTRPITDEASPRSASLRASSAS